MCQTRCKFALAHQVFQRLRVRVDDFQVVLQPGHLAFVPRGLEFAESGNLVNELLLLADPQRTVKKICTSIDHSGITFKTKIAATEAGTTTASTTQQQSLRHQKRRKTTKSQTLLNWLGAIKSILFCTSGLTAAAAGS